MKRVGILVGREKTFPEALIKGINERGRGDVVAEYITLGGIKYDDPPKYDLVVDRISHEVPFYRATLKRQKIGRCYSQDSSLAAEGLHRRHR